MGSIEQSPLTAEINSRAQYGSENVNNSVKEEPSTDPSAPVKCSEQVPASELPTVPGISSNEMVNKDDVEGQVTPIKPSKVSVGTRQKRRNLGTDATVVDSPDWLPNGWITELKFRESGSTAGTKDKYYFDPVSGHRFRSKPDVLRFLHTGQIMKCKPKPKLFGTGNSSQAIALQLVDSLNLQKPVINSNSGVSNNLIFETNLGSDPTCAKKDGDESTCAQTREASIPMSNGFKGEESQHPEAIEAAVRDVLLEEHNKTKSLNSECKMDMKRKQHPDLDGQTHDGVKECSSHELQCINTSAIITPDGLGNKVKRRKQNGHLTVATRLHMAVTSNETPDVPVQRPGKASLAFPSITFAQAEPSDQEQSIFRVQNSAKHNGTDCFIITTKVSLFSNTSPESAINKPSEASILPMQGQPHEPSLVPPIHDDKLKYNHQASCLDMLVENSMVKLNIGSSSAIPGSSKVVPIPDPSSPCSVLHAKKPIKSWKRTRKLKASPQEMKKHLVALGRKLCRKVMKQNLHMSQTSAQPIDLKSH